MIRELDLVVLLHDVDEVGLRRGDVGTVVHAYSNAPAYEVEFVTADGYTVGLLTLTDAEVRLRQGRELLHVRDFTAPPARHRGEDTSGSSGEPAARRTAVGSKRQSLSG